LFDPAAYFDSLEQALKGCQTYAEATGPIASISRDRFNKWEWCIWRLEVVFPDGCKLTAFEGHTMRKGKHLRNFTYRLTKAGGELIVQVDPHGRQVPFSTTPHIHIGPDQDNRVFEGDAQLKGYSLRDYDFLKMWELVETYISGGGLPWQT